MPAFVGVRPLPVYPLNPMLWGARCLYNTSQTRRKGDRMTEQAAHPAPEIHITDIVLPNQTNNEN
jgi:hypothetical protein